MRTCHPYPTTHTITKGTIPTQLGLCAKLEIGLWVDQNMLTVRPPPLLLPACMEQKVPRNVSQVSFNTHTHSPTHPPTRVIIQSTIPTQLGGLVKSYYGMDLWSNQLIGTIPTQLGRLVKLTQYISFYGNSLTGWVPTELGNLEEVFHRKSDESQPATLTEGSYENHELTSYFHGIRQTARIWLVDWRQRHHGFGS